MASSFLLQNPPFSLLVNHHRHHSKTFFSKATTSPRFYNKSHRILSSRPLNNVPLTVVGPNSKLLQRGPYEATSVRTISAKSTGSDNSPVSAGIQTVFGVMHLVVSLGLILAVDKYLKAAFVAAAIKFPSALFGMFCTFSILLVLDSTVPVAATTLENFFEPALLFIQRWLPLFYVPSLVVLPLAVQDIPAASGIKILFIIGISIILISIIFHWKQILVKISL